MPGAAVALAAIVIIVALQFLKTGGSFDVQGQTIGNIAPLSNGVATMAAAIKQAEGSDPAYNNPGDIKPPGWQGPMFGAGIPIFQSPAEGLSRLYFELNLIANGQSSVYSLSDTIDNMAAKWTGNDNAANWALTVASALGTETSATLAEVLV